MSKYTSVPGFFGETEYYNEKGEKVGESWNNGIFGQEVFYNDRNEAVAEKWPTILGNPGYYDMNGDLRVHELHGILTEKTYYDGNNNFVGDGITDVFGMPVTSFYPDSPF